MQWGYRFLWKLSLNLFSSRVSLVRLFEKVHNEKVEFQKTECLVKTVKKCIMKKLSVWLVLIKVAF